MARLKSFTLLEISVALLLTGILAALSYAIIGNMGRTAARWSAIDRDPEAIRSCSERMTVDLDLADPVFATQEGFTLRSGALDPITYRLDAGAWIRSCGSANDTLLTKVMGIERFWQGTVVTDGGAPLDVIVLSLHPDGDALNLYFTKHYDAMTLRAIQHEHADPSPQHTAL